jgi:hypothetical protein
MEQDHSQLDMDETRKRPKYLTVLCILSFISIGFFLSTGLVNLVSGPSSEEQMKEMQVLLTNSVNEMETLGADWLADMMSKVQERVIEENDNFYLASFVTITYLLLGLFGVLKMWKGEKRGFHLYITYCLLSVISMYLYVSPANISTFSVVASFMFSGLFILMYSRNLKWMQ